MPPPRLGLFRERADPTRLGNASIVMRAGPLLAAALLCGVVAPAQTGYQGIKENLPLRVAPQPFPFNHQRHVSAGAACLDCHRGADKRERAGLPQADQCMLCHAAIRTESPAIQQLSKIHEKGEKIDWVRVYELLDFVFFSHAGHTKAGIACKTCHGPVAERKVLAKEVSTSMTACMNCHEAKEVSNDCFLCHELGQ